MNRMNTRKYKLLQAVLASSCLIMPGVVFGDCYINNIPNQGTCNDPPYTGSPYVSAEEGATIIITEDGGIVAPAGTAGFEIIHKNNTINILGDANPGEPTAIDAIGGLDGIQIQEDGAVINVGINREITASENGIGIDADASNVVVNNSGKIYGINNSIDIDSAENTIINNADDGVIGGGDNGIYTTGENTTINNSGLIQGAVGGGGFHAIHIDNGAKNAVINNLSDGVIQTDNGNSDVIEIHEEGATITNSGQIIAKQGLNAIDVQKNFKNITNNAGGLIESSGDGIIVNGDADVTGNIVNSGTIQVTGNDNAINITNKLIGNIINNAGGVIQTTDPGATGDVILLNNSIANLNNSGDILATGTAQAIEVTKAISGNINNQAGGRIISEDGTTIHLDNGLDGSIFNAGEIRSVTDVTAAPLVSGKAVVLKIDGGTVTGNITNAASGEISTGDASAISLNGTTINKAFVNNGTIQNDSAGNATISVNGNTKITEHFTNTGTIENLDFGNGIAIDFSDPGVDIKLIQNNGTITGDVILSHAGGENFDLNGGQINGDVFGGEGHDIVNITGGSYGSLNGSNGNNTLNIKNSFTTTGPISNFQTVNAEAGSFTVANPITDVDTVLKVKSGATVIAVGPGKIIDGVGSLDIEKGGALHILNGSEVNIGNTIVKGTLDIGSQGVLKTTGYTQHQNAVLNVVLTDGAHFFIDVQGAADFKNSSRLYANVGGVPVSDGSIYNVLKTTAGVTDGGLIIDDSSATLKFSVDPSVLPNTLRLVANTIPFAEVVAGSEITEGVANTLDNLLSNGTNSQDLNDLIGQLQTLGTDEDVENALRMLVPNHNHSLAANSLFSVHRSFDDIGMRLEELLGLYPLLQESDVYRDEEDERSYNYYNRYGYGYNYGDGDGSPLMRHRTGSWVKPYASIIDQRNRDTVDGYKADSIGFSAGADWRILDWATIGLAFNYGKTDVTQRGMFDNKQKINSYQFTFYGAFDPIGPIYVNTLIGLGWHNYKTNRAISVGTVKSTAQSDFNGLHYAGKLEVGYAWFNGKYYISPLASVRYTYLELDNYTDDGAGGLNLSTRYEPVTELLGSLGIKLASKNEYLEAVYVPELAAYINYDFQQDRQETLNNFLGGGPSFKSYGIKPAQASFVVSPSLRMHSYRNFMFKIAYEFEAKKQFIAHSAYLKWYYKWD